MRTEEEINNLIAIRCKEYDELYNKREDVDDVLATIIFLIIFLIICIIVSACIGSVLIIKGV